MQRRHAVVVSHRLEIDAPIERVFALVDDPEKTKLWMRGLEETVFTTRRSRANPVGARFTQRIRHGRRIAEYDGRVTAYERPHRLALRIGDGRGAFDVEYRLSDLGGRTRLDYTATGSDPTGLARPAGAFFAWVTRRIAGKQMQRLKTVAEAAAAAG
jgi:uncharacterized protein YndB with AHSA1/START domain